MQAAGAAVHAQDEGCHGPRRQHQGAVDEDR